MASQFSATGANDRVRSDGDRRGVRIGSPTSGISSEGCADSRQVVVREAALAEKVGLEKQGIGESCGATDLDETRLDA